MGTLPPRTLYPTITFTLPVSSSSVTKTTPLAVDGCYRAVTLPQARTSLPLGRSRIWVAVHCFIFNSLSRNVDKG